MRRFGLAALGIILLIAPAASRAQATQTQTLEDDAAKNAKQARAALDAMVQALGGDAWLNMKNRYMHGHAAGFFHGDPDPGTLEMFEFHAWPDHDRVDVTKHRDVVEYFIGRQGWELTYRGKRPLPQEQVDDFLRRRDHSIEAAVKVWMKDPKTILVYEGQHLAARKLAEQVTLIASDNEAVTILMDVQTHLPLRREFQWRDPIYKDKNTDAEEYDDYHVVEGLPTAFTVTRYKNNEIVRQFYVDKVQYNQDLNAEFWDVNANALRIKK
ncbi:MAG TPA: hypothetical protein VGJ21_25815 [Terracidiphilus sp.]|jgi:hypothetical protein